MTEKTNVYGQAILKVDFDVNLPISEEEFEQLSERQQDELIDSHINWHDATRNAEVDEFDVYEYRKVEG